MQQTFYGQVIRPGDILLIVEDETPVRFLRMIDSKYLDCEWPPENPQCSGYFNPSDLMWPDDPSEPMRDKSKDKESFSTGAVRDTQEGKSRPDFMDPRMLLRYGEHMRKGGERYGEFNFDKGIPSQRYMASLMRHVLLYYSGDRSEDHLSAIIFNVTGIAINEGGELDDLHKWRT